MGTKIDLSQIKDGDKDAQLVSSVDTLAELPAAADNSGQVRYVDGIGIVKSDGTDWLPSAEEAVSVEAFGAVADHVRGEVEGTDNYSAFLLCSTYAKDNNLIWYVPKREKMFRISEKLTVDLTDTDDTYCGGLVCAGEIFSDVSGDFAIHIKGRQTEGFYQNRYVVDGLRLYSDYTSWGIWLERLDHEGISNIYLEGVLAPWVRMTDLREVAPRQVVMKYCGKTTGRYGIEFFENDAVAPNTGVMDATNLINLDSWYAVYCAGNYVGVVDTNTGNDVRSVEFTNSVLHYLDFDPAGTPLVRDAADTLIHLDTPCQIVWSGGVIRKGVGTAGNAIAVSNEARLKITGAAELSGEGTGLNYISNTNTKNPVVIGQDVLINNSNGTVYTGLAPEFLLGAENKCGNADLLTARFDQPAGCAGWGVANGTLVRNGDKSATFTATADNGFCAAIMYDTAGIGIVNVAVEVKSSTANHNISVFAFDVGGSVIGGPYATAPTSGAGVYELLSKTVELPANTAYIEARLGNSMLNGQVIQFRKPRFTRSSSVAAYSESAYNTRMELVDLGAIGASAAVNVNADIGNEIFSFSVCSQSGEYEYFNVQQTLKNRLFLNVKANATGIPSAKLYVTTNTM